jgi:OOP family OmpA-OmpF porin
MSQGRMARKLVVVGIMSLFAAYTATAQSQQQEQQQKTTIYPVSFPSGGIELHKADQETIHGVAAMMERDPVLHAAVLGKADAVGTPEYNDHLSWRRAAAVFEALVFTYKVPASRVEMRWTGDRLPSVPGGDQKAELQNRVVDIIVH